MLSRISSRVSSPVALVVRSRAETTAAAGWPSAPLWSRSQVRAEPLQAHETRVARDVADQHEGWAIRWILGRGREKPFGGRLEVDAARTVRRDVSARRRRSPDRKADLDHDRIRCRGQQSLGRGALPIVPVGVLDNENELPVAGGCDELALVDRGLAKLDELRRQPRPKGVSEPVVPRVGCDRGLGPKLDYKRRADKLNPSLG